MCCAAGVLIHQFACPQFCYKVMLSDLPARMHAQVKAVAAAAEAALKAFVALLNPQGISIILPDLLAALDTKKVGSRAF